MANRTRSAIGAISRRRRRWKTNPIIAKGPGAVKANKPPGPMKRIKNRSYNRVHYKCVHQNGTAGDRCHRGKGVNVTHPAHDMGSKNAASREPQKISRAHDADIDGREGFNTGANRQLCSLLSIAH